MSRSSNIATQMAKCGPSCFPVERPTFLCQKKKALSDSLQLSASASTKCHPLQSSLEPPATPPPSSRQVLTSASSTAGKTLRLPAPGLLQSSRIQKANNLPSPGAPSLTTILTGVASSEFVKRLSSSLPQVPSVTSSSASQNLPCLSCLMTTVIVIASPRSSLLFLLIPLESFNRLHTLGQIISNLTPTLRFFLWRTNAMKSLNTLLFTLPNTLGAHLRVMRLGRLPVTPLEGQFLRPLAASSFPASQEKLSQEAQSFHSNSTARAQKICCSNRFVVHTSTSTRSTVFFFKTPGPTEPGPTRSDPD